jgi:hypothetical protein
LVHSGVIDTNVHKICDFIVNCLDVVILVNFVDNCFFWARTEDGLFNPPQKDNSGRYHVDCEIVCAPQETAKQVFINLFPLLQRFNNVPKIVLVPIPRFLYAPCCSNIEHVPDMESGNHMEKIMADLGLKRTRFFSFSRKAKIKRK